MLAIRTFNDPEVIVEGHTDSTGSIEVNQQLSQERATAVKEYLVSRGVAGNRLQTVSFGKERPIEICSNEACYAKNRRAVTVLASGVSG